MTKVVFKNRTLPMIDRDSFLTPFDKMFDQLVSAQFPEMTKTVGVNPMSNSAYPKVNVYEYDDKVGVVAEIPGLDKKDLSIDVEDGILTIKSIVKEAKDKKEDGVIHKGIAKRMFSKSFTIADDVEVKGAELKDGLLKVSLERIIPESRKAKTISIK